MKFAVGSEKRIGIVTGASAGLGAEFVRQLEQHFYVDEIWLVARREDAMMDLAASLVRAEGVVLPLDLTISSDIRKLEEKLKVDTPNVVVLINNAGFGKMGAFSEIDREAQLKCIDLNVRSLTEITHICLPYMQQHSHLIQVASSIAWVAAANFAIYSASKAFVLNMTRALRQELQRDGIQVIAVCPGPVKTEFFDVATNPNSVGKLQDESEPRPKPSAHLMLAATAKDVVSLAFRDSKAGKSVSIYGWPIRLFTILAHILPASWMTKLTERRNK